MRPSRTKLLCLIAAAFSSSCRTTDSNSDVKFYGADSQSAEMTYESYIEIDIPQGVTSANQLTSAPQNESMLDIINYQIQHMFGAFTEHPGYRKNPGIIEARGIPEIKNAELDQTTVKAKVFYTYKDKVVFKKRLLNNGPTQITFVLPKDPTTIYEKGFKPGEPLNKCTDEHYNTEDDFWYFWNPKQAGCPIKKADLVEVTADLEPILNTKNTYPYYDKILGDNGNGRDVRIVYLVGIDENFHAGDLGRQTFQDAVQLLKQNGFKVKAGGTVRKKILTLNTTDYDVQVEMYLMNPDSNPFVKRAADGLENADVFIYDGHSGLGGYLNLERFEGTLGRKLKLPMTKSQIFYFNGCSTFSYYNGDYFDLKKSAQDPEGNTNLDVITTSIGANFDIGARHDVSFITGLVDGSRPSWQQIMNQIYKVDKSQTALTHVNGDEDNPATPQ